MEADPLYDKVHSGGVKPDYMKRIWYAMVAMGVFMVVITVFAGVSMGYIISTQGLEAMESVRSMRQDTHELHDAVMMGRKLAEESEMLTDAKGAIHHVAEILRRNPEIVQQTLTQANLLVSRTQELISKFTPEQMDFIKQNLISISDSVRGLMTTLTPAQMSSSLTSFEHLSGNATQLMLRMATDNVIKDFTSLAEITTSLGQRLLETEQITVTVPRFSGKRLAK